MTELTFTFFHEDGPIVLTETELCNEYMRLREAECGLGDWKSMPSGTFDLNEIEADARACMDPSATGVFAGIFVAAYPEAVLALVEVVKAAQHFITTYNNATVLTDTTDARIALKAALKPFGDEQSSSSGGAS